MEQPLMEKFQIKELIVDDVSDVLMEPPLMEKLIDSAKQSLEIFHIHFSELFDEVDHPENKKISEALATCALLKNLKITIRDVGILIREFLRPLKSLESLEICKFEAMIMYELREVLTEDEDEDEDDEVLLEDEVPSSFPVNSKPFQLQTLRFTNPNLDISHQLIGARLVVLNQLLSLQYASSIRELEFHHCDNYDDLARLPIILDDAVHLTHFKLVFMQNLEFTETQMQNVFGLLENVIDLKDDDIKISITFEYSDVDLDAKLSIVYSLLGTLFFVHGNLSEEKCVSV